MPKLTNLSVVGLDYDQIKTSLKTYLQSQDEFADFNFEGSSISMLINLLAYNTHYQSFYLNMVANEMFLDSARQRGSVASLAKALGYTPLSSKAPEAELSLSMVYAALGGGETRVTVVDKYTEFIYTSSAGDSFTFLATDDFSITDDGGTGTATVTVKEGSLATYSYIYDSTNPNQALIIPSTIVDIDTLTVDVYESPSSTTRVEYTKASDLSSLTSSSQVYFITENNDGLYEVYFGDDTIGAKPTNGSKIQFRYIETNETDANGAGVNEGTTSQFALVEALTGWTTTATVSSAAAGGATKQSIDQIRFLAPLFYESQDRAVTIRDYETLVKQYYPTTDSLLIYGGEDASPPQYGKVFIAIKPVEGSTTSNLVKNNIVNLLKSKNIITITPEVVDPEILYIKVKTNVYYDPRVTSKSSGTILSEVVSAIQEYSTDTLEKFNRSLFHSKYATMVDNVDTSINHSVTDFSVYRRITPSFTDASGAYTINMVNEILHPRDGYSEPVITSDSFVHYDSVAGSNVTAYMEDDGSGTMRLYKFVSGVKTVFKEDIGTVDYTTGTINLTDWLPLSIPSGRSYVRVYAELAGDDVMSKQNTILSISSSDITTTIAKSNDDVNKPVNGY